MIFFYNTSGTFNFEKNRINIFEFLIFMQTKIKDQYGWDFCESIIF